MKNFKKYLSKQYLLLIFSIVLGLLVLVLGSSYAIYVVNLTGNDTEKDVAIKITNIKLDISNETGELALCKPYPIKTSEGLSSCTPFNFTLTNNNKADVYYYLNFELNSEVPKEAFHIAFAECDDASCTNPDYNDARLDELIDNPDTALLNYNGKLLKTGTTAFEKGTSKTFSVIFWIDEDYTKDSSYFTDKNVNTQIAAIAYTRDPNTLTFTAEFDLSTYSKYYSWDDTSCSSEDGYTIEGSKCTKTYSVKDTFQMLPVPNDRDLEVSWFKDSAKQKEITVDTGFVLKAKQTFYAGIVNTATPTCTLMLADGNITSTNIAKYNLTYYGWDSSYSGNNSSTKPIELGISAYYLKDDKDLSSSCYIDVTDDIIVNPGKESQPAFQKTGGGWYCSSGWELSGSTCYRDVYSYSCQEGYTNYDNTYCYKNIDISDTPTCDLTISEGNIVSFNKSKYKLEYFGFNSSYTGENVLSKAVEYGLTSYYIKDEYGITNTCSITVEASTASTCTESQRAYEDGKGGYYCSSGWTKSGSTCSREYTCYNCPSGYTLSGSYCIKY